MITNFKIFENNSDFKKYFISKFFDGYSICELLNVDTKKSKVFIQLLYVYNNELKELIDNTNSEPYFKSLSVLNNRMLYSSDNLKKCIEVIPTLSDISNYNL